MADVDAGQEALIEAAESALEVVGGSKEVPSKQSERAGGEEAPAAAPAGGAAGSTAGGMNAVMSIPVSIEIVLGRARMPLSRLMQLGRGAIIQLDRRVGEQVDVVVNDRVVARGEVVILDEDQARFGVSLTSVVGSTEAEEADA